MRIRIIVVLSLLMLSGCDGGLGEGVLIGLGSSAAVSEGQELAQQKKTALVAEIVKLRSALDIAKEQADPAERLALEAKLDELEKKQARVEMTDLVATMVKDAVSRDWGSNPAEGQDGKNNLAYILGTLATVATGYAGKKTLESSQKDKALNRVKIAAKAQNDGEKEAEIYKLIDNV